jgi:hypothetical protein
MNVVNDANKAEIAMIYDILAKKFGSEHANGIGRRKNWKKLNADLHFY